MAFTPMRVDGTSVFFVQPTGGFDVRGCPEPKELAAFVSKACNNHENLLAVLRDISQFNSREGYMAASALRNLKI